MPIEDSRFQQRLDEVADILTSDDADRIVNLYTKDGQVMPPGSDVVSGKEAVADFWQTIGHDLRVETLDIEPVEVEDYGNTAVRIGRATLSDAGAETLDQVKFIEIWKEDNGEWKLHRDIWNSNLSAEQ